MMRRRCYTCKCLEWESSIKFYERTHDDPKARFYCRKCARNGYQTIEAAKLKNVTPPTTPIKKRRRYSNTHKATVSVLRRIPIQIVSDEERLAIGRFYRKRPEGCEIDHIIPIPKGGRHELSNLQYLSKEDHLKKTAKERTKIEKLECEKMYPFTPMPEGDQSIDVSDKKRNKGSKFNSIRRLVKK